jgi:hypothetical protein
MGYRSSIAFCLSVNEFRVEPETGNAYDDYDRAKFKEMVGFFKLTKFYEIAISSDYDLLNKKSPSLGWSEGKIVFYAEDWKWYSDYPLVIAYNEMWENMQDIEGISGYFLRVGEGDGNQMDVEEDQFGDDPDYQHFSACASMYFNADEFLGEQDTDETETTQKDTATTQPDCAGANHATQAE